MICVGRHLEKFYNRGLKNYAQKFENGTENKRFYTLDKIINNIFKKFWTIFFYFKTPIKYILV